MGDAPHAAAIGGRRAAPGLSAPRLPFMPQPPRGDARSPQLRLLPPGRPCKSRGGGKERGVPRGGSPATRRAPASASAARPGAAAASSPRCPRGLRRSGAGSVPRAPGLGQRQGPRGRRLPPALTRVGAAPSSPVPSRPPRAGLSGPVGAGLSPCLGGCGAEPSVCPSARSGLSAKLGCGWSGVSPSGRTDGTREQSAPSGPARPGAVSRPRRRSPRAAPVSGRAGPGLGSRSLPWSGERGERPRPSAQ